MSEHDALRSSGAVERVSERFYSGVWGVLVRWMRVPKEPPTLPVPEGEEVLAIHPSLGFLRYLKFWFWLVLFLTDVVFVALWVALIGAIPWAGFVTTPLWLAIIIVPDIVAYVAIHLRYDTTWYVLSNRSIRIRRGVWIIREISLTYENVQNVRVSQGPLQRYFGIAKLQVETAGSGGSAGAHGGGGSASNVGLIEGIDHAEELRDLIMARVRASRSAGLGDEHAGYLSHDQQGMWTPEHLAALREIRDLALAR